MPSQKILGLDLGTSSVGWALVEQEEQLKQVDIIDSGVRIFPEGVDRRKGEKSLNQDRRDARSIRRQVCRKARRKKKLEGLLTDLELLPVDPAIRAILFSDKHNDPYQLRAKALDEKLEPFQFGRALYHLAQRRGYLSNRKTGSEKDGTVSQGITELSEQMERTGSRTIGEYFYKLKSTAKIRGVYTHRQMFIDEFNMLWEAQKRYFSHLNSRSKSIIYDAIFYQRPLKIQKHLIGTCALEPDRRRAYAATIAAQNFRLLQTINNLNVQLQVGEQQSLDTDQKQLLYAKLANQKSMTWGAIKKLLGYLEGDKFNLENVRASGLQGNVTAAIVRNALPKNHWESLTSKQQEDLVFDLLHIESEPALLRRLSNHWQLSLDEAHQLADKSLALPKGTMSYSHKAIRNLLPHLQQGMTIDKATVAAGYQFSTFQEKGTQSLLPLFDQDLRNPMVQRAMYQVRRIVNAVIKRYGMPDVIRVEMARDLRNNSKRRQQIQTNQRKFEKQNQQAKDILQSDFGIPNPSRDDLVKYRLWQECHQQCPFTGKPIPAEKLFSGDVEIEHIIPYTRCLDDSYMNKTLCYRAANQEKANRTPEEMFAGNRAGYEAILQRVKHFPRPKKERFNKDVSKFLDDFVSQQLNETGYIAKQTHLYLKQLECRIEVIKGGVTAKLRHAWGLNSILSDTGEKTRLDHRHHAVDALTLALTDRKAVQRISDLSSPRSNGRFKIVNYPLPCSDFRQRVRASVETIVTSHKAQHKIKGPLHEETLYGVGELDDQGNPKTVVIRKALELLKEKDLHLIRDEKIRDMALNHVKQYGEPKKSFSNPNRPFGFTNKESGDFTPIRSVRIEYPLNVEQVGKGHRKRFVKLGSNHHAEIYMAANAKGKQKWTSDIVSTLEAKHRQKNKLPVVNSKDADGNSLVMALHINDMVELEHEGKRLTCRVQKMTLSGNRITLRKHNDADLSKAGEITKTAESLRKANCRLLYVDTLGWVKNHDQTDN